MPYYVTCAHCGANLDPGETCECQKKPMFLSIKDLAERWACSPDLIRSIIRSGDLPSLKIGSIHRIAFSDVERYEERRNDRPATVPKTKREPVLRL